MRAFGSDRVRQGNAEQWILFCRRSKDWLPRVPKTLTTPEHPGTAVLWEERFFEVVAAQPTGSGGIRYVLEPWRDEHVMRVSEAYDEPSEARREEEFRAAQVRNKARKTANVAGVVTGLLPASVQEQLGSELGLLPSKLTALSLLLPFAFLIWFALHFVQGIFDNKPTPLSLTLFAVYLMFESAIRLNLAWFQRRPIGSAVAFFPYLLFYLLGGKRAGAASPFEVPRGQKLFITQPTDDIALRDAYTMREPLLTLLSAAEQEALAQRFGFEYRKHAYIVAWTILAMASAGIVSSFVSLQSGPRFGPIVSIIVAVALVIEQISRLRSLRRGPAPSMLAVVVRPISRKLLA